MLSHPWRVSRAARLHSLLVPALALLVSACGTLTMKPPQSKTPLMHARVEGHTPSLSSRDRELRFANVTVSHVEGTPILPPGLTAYGRMPDQDSWKYSYEVSDGRKTLRAECHERVGEIRYYGLGETTLDVQCRCLSGDKPEAEVEIQRGQGKALLAPNHRFAVFGTRGSAEGKRSRAILGYRFQSGTSVGAVDVTKRAAVFMSNDVAPEQRLPLQCLYAGLLLHRPNR